MVQTTILAFGNYLQLELSLSFFFFFQCKHTRINSAQIFQAGKALHKYFSLLFAQLLNVEQNVILTPNYGERVRRAKAYKRWEVGRRKLGMPTPATQVIFFHKLLLCCAVCVCVHDAGKTPRKLQREARAGKISLFFCHKSIFRISLKLDSHKPDVHYYPPIPTFLYILHCYTCLI